MRALYMMSCVFCLVVAIPAAASSINPHQVTNFDRTTCDSLPGTQVWSEEVGACVCSSDSNPYFEPRAAKGEGRCLPETVWSEYQEVFGPTEPVQISSTPSNSHPQIRHADTDNDGYSDEWDTDDNDPSVSPAVVVSVTRASEPTPPSAFAVEPAPVINDPAPEPVPPAEETVESGTSNEDATEQEHREREVREAEEARQAEERREAEELEHARAERERREAEHQAELERREREAAAEREAERRRAEETNIVAEREQELELGDDDDYFANDDADAHIEPAPVPELEPEPVALPDLDDGPAAETAAERKARLKTERDERRAEQRLAREAEQEQKRHEREAEAERRERERKLDDYANRLASIEWNRGHLSYRRYQGNDSVDTDSDGLPDDMDLCPTEPEDFDHFVDSTGTFLPLDGCPDDETGFIRLSWDGDGEDKRFFDLKPAFTDSWEKLDQGFWFHEDGSYTETTMELLRELALILEAYDLKVEIKGRSPGGESAEQKFADRQIVGGWSRLMAEELISQCEKAGYTDCKDRVYDSAATGYSGIKHNTIIIGLVTH